MKKVMEEEERVVEVWGFSVGLEWQERLWLAREYKGTWEIPVEKGVLVVTVEAAEGAVVVGGEISVPM